MSKTNGHARLSVRTERITPKKAADYLEFNTRNRPIRRNNWEKIVRAMKGGDWHSDGSPIQFSWEDPPVLLNGQNRLKAIVEAGVTVDMVVVRGVDPAAQYTMDTGAKRSLRDALHATGAAQTAYLSATIHHVYYFKVAGGFGNRFYQASIPELLEFYEQHPGIADSIQPGRTVGEYLKRIPATMWSALHYMMSEVDKEDAEAFFYLLRTGSGLTDGDAPLVLRQQLLRQVTHPLPRPIYAAWVIKAFNAWREGRTVRVLVFKPNIEEYPKILNYEEASA